MMVIRSNAVFSLGSGCGERNQNDNAGRDFRHLTIAHSSRLILSISFFWHFSLLPNLQQIWVSPLSRSETTLFILLFWQSLCQNDICYACLFYRLCTTWGRDLVPFIHIPSTWYRVDVQLTACWLIVLPTPWYIFFFLQIWVRNIPSFQTCWLKEIALLDLIMIFLNIRPISWNQETLLISC